MRKVKLGVAVEDMFQVLTRTAPKFNDAYAAVEWFVARLPEVGDFLSRDHEENIRVYTRDYDPATKAPGIIVAYQYDADEVEILMLDIIQSGDGA